MKSILNYIGQLRLYSLVDLIVLLIVVKANSHELIGAVLLHIGFLAYLESMHGHSYRERVPGQAGIIIIVLGSVLYGHVVATTLFVFFSFLYSLKTKDYLGVFAPIARSLQYFALIGGITGFSDRFLWIVIAAVFIRNLIGDVRDSGKDKNEKLKTIPVLLGINKNIKYIHLFAVFTTTILWWSYSSIPIHWLFATLLVEAFSYNLTPR